MHTHVKQGLVAHKYFNAILEKETLAAKIGCANVILHTLVCNQIGVAYCMTIIVKKLPDKTHWCSNPF